MDYFTSNDTTHALYVANGMICLTKRNPACYGTSRRDIIHIFSARHISMNLMSNVLEIMDTVYTL